jgi:hypothetical protein
LRGTSHPTGTLSLCNSSKNLKIFRGCDALKSAFREILDAEYRSRTEEEKSYNLMNEYAKKTPENQHKKAKN